MRSQTIAEFIEEHVNRGESPAQIAGNAILTGVIGDTMPNYLQLREMAMKVTRWDIQNLGNSHDAENQQIQLKTKGSFTNLNAMEARRLAKALLCAAQELDGSECITACFKVQGRISHAHREDLIERVEAAIEESNLFDGVEVL